MTGTEGGSSGPYRLRILDGGRKGEERLLEGDRIVIGRSHEADVRLDPERDLAVSAVHAELRLDGGRWTLRDLDSRNGTFLNGTRVEGPLPAREGDVLRLGADGPELRLLRGPPVQETVGTRTALRGFERPSRRTAQVAAALFVVVALLAGTSALLYRGQRDRAALERERDRLHATVDSLLDREQRTFGALEGELRTLAEALERSRAEVERLRAEVSRSEEGSRDDPSELLGLRRDLEEATQALARQQMAASLDFERIEGANRPAVTLVFVETEDGRVVTGTGFTVRDDATLVTARHLLEDAGGEISPRRVAVQFSDSDQVWPARVLAVSGTLDLAVLRAENIQGAVPVVHGLNQRPDTVQSGSPVALLGFPLGGSFTAAEAAGAGRPPVRPLLSAGVVRESSRDWMEIQGFGEAGASGSPVFDAGGEVIAVIYGGERDARGGVLVAVPSDRVVELLERAGLR